MKLDKINPADQFQLAIELLNGIAEGKSWPAGDFYLMLDRIRRAYAVEKLARVYEYLKDQREKARRGSAFSDAMGDRFQVIEDAAEKVREISQENFGWMPRYL